MTHPTYLRYEVLRTFRNRRFLIFSLAFPLVLLLSIGSVEPPRDARRHLVPALLHGRDGELGRDGGDDLLRGSYRGRAPGRLDAPAAHHAAADRARTSAPRSSAGT